MNGSSGTGTSQNCDPFASATDGLCYVNAATRLEHILDGTSNTLAFTESLRGRCDSPALTPAPDLQRYVAFFGLNVAGLMGYATTAQDSGLEAVLPDVESWNSQRLCNWFKMDMTPGTIMNGGFTPHSPIPDMGVRRIRVTAARSRHPGWVNAVMASVRAWRWEFGVLRSQGVTRSGLFRMILAEGLLIGLITCLLSLGFGVFSGWCGTGISQYVSFFGGLAPPLVLPRPQLAFGFSVTLALCLAAALWPAVSTGRAEPLRLLQEGRAAL